MKLSKSLLFPITAAIGMLATATSVSAASVAAISVTGASRLTNDFDTGYSFTTTSTIYVTHLGTFDANGGGLAGNATVGLFNTGSGAAGNLITSAVVTAASPSEVNGGYDAYYTAIAPVMLTAGTYFVAATNNSADGFLFGGTKTTASGITFNKGEANAGRSTLGANYDAYSTDNVGGYFGGTFKFDTVNPIPEPSAALLGGLGFLALLRRRR